MKFNIEVRPSFSISQNKASLRCLEQIREFFNCGGIRFSKRDQTYKYEVRTLSHLNEHVIPHFREYCLYTQKKEDFQTFTRICDLMKRNLHVSPSGLEQVIHLAYTMNVSGKRKYTKQQLLNFLKL